MIMRKVADFNSYFFINHVDYIGPTGHTGKTNMEAIGNCYSLHEYQHYR